MRFRSYVDGSERFIGPGDLDGGAGRAGLGHRAGVRRVPAVPRHARVHRPLDRAHAPLARPLPVLARASTGPSGRASTGSCRAASTRTCAAGARRRSPRATTFGIAIGGTLGQDKAQMYEVVGWTTEELPEERPRHLLGIGDVDDLLRGVELGIDTFDCAMPTRIGRHGMAVVPDPERALARRPRQGPLPRRPTSRCATAARARPARRATRAPTCTTSSASARRPGARIVTLHNLAYLQLLMAALRDAIDAGRLSEARRGGARAGAAAAGTELAQRVLSSIRPWISSTACSTSPSTRSRSCTPRRPVSVDEHVGAAARRRQQREQQQRPQRPQEPPLAAPRGGARAAAPGGRGAGAAAAAAAAAAARRSAPCRRRRGGRPASARAASWPRCARACACASVAASARVARRRLRRDPAQRVAQRVLHRGGVGEAVAGVALERARHDQRRARAGSPGRARAAAAGARRSCWRARSVSEAASYGQPARRAAGRRRRRARRGRRPGRPARRAPARARGTRPCRAPSRPS